MDGQTEEKRNEEEVKNEDKHPFLSSPRLYPTLVGLIFIFLALVTLLNYGPVGHFLSYIVAYAIGVFYYPLLAGMVILGLFNLIKGRFVNFRLNFTGLGYVLLLIFGTLASSLWVKDLSFSTFSEIFREHMDSITSSPFTLTSVLDIGKVGGGFVGFFFTSLFVSGLGRIGTYVFCYLFLVVAAFLIFRIPALAVYEDIRDTMARREAKRRKENNLTPEPKLNPDGKEKKEETRSFTVPSPFTSTSYSSKEKPEDEDEDESDDEEMNASSPMTEQLNDNSTVKIARHAVKDEVVVPNIPSPFSSSYGGVNDTAKPEVKADFTSEAAKEEAKAVPGASPSYSTPSPDETIENKPIESQKTADYAAPSPFSEPSYMHEEPLPDEKKEDTSSIPVVKKSGYKDEDEEDDFFFDKKESEKEKDHLPMREEVAFDDRETDEEKDADLTLEREETAVPEAQEKASKPAAPSHPSVSVNVSTHASSNPNDDISKHGSINEHYDYIKPGIDLLSDKKDYSRMAINQQAAQSKIDVINGVYRKLGIAAHVQDYTIGPSVTRFNIDREPGVRVSQIISADVEQEMQIDLNGDMSVRLEAVVRGRDTSAVEVGNPSPMTVPFRDAFGAVMSSPKQDPLLIPLGMDIDRQVVCVSLDSLPHLLVSGTTGSGKSVFIQSIIMTLIMRNYPSDLKLILVDPKQVEFTRYTGLPHLLCPIITNITYAVAMLKRLVNEMERRYTILARYQCSNIHDYQKVRKEKPELENLPNIVVIIDEFADMMGQDPKDVDLYTQRLAQKARAAGIYLIIATQRPSVKCITGTIKANIPARIALVLPSIMDSRTILDEGGAEKLLGKGDLLAKIPSLKSTIRLQSAFVSNEEISAVADYLRSKAEPHYDEDFMNFDEPEDDDDYMLDDSDLPGFKDEYYPRIKSWVMSTGIASTSALQRNFGIGYSRAASIIDALDAEGITRITSGNKHEVIVREDADGNGVNTGE